MNVNIIFLDIDGVVRTARTNMFREEFDVEWDKYCVEMINNLCDEFNAKIVISSTERMVHPMFNSKNYAVEYLCSKGFSYDTLWYDTPEFKTPSYPGESRWKEIKKWLYSNIPSTKVNVKALVLDDDNIFMILKLAKP